MSDYLIIKLQGAMQSWGSHTFEDYRPSYIFPTRSAVVGLLGACIGIEREDFENREALNSSLEKLTVRADPRFIKNRDVPLKMHKISDFHTVQNVRKVDKSARKDAVVSRREYLCDAEFTVAMTFSKGAVYTLETIKQAIKKPYYTPFLGRKSCPLQRPLYEATINADDAQLACQDISPKQGTFYSEETLINASPFEVRDIPVADPVRQFAARTVYILGDENVS